MLVTGPLGLLTEQLIDFTSPRLGFNLSLVQLLELREAFHSADYQCIIREYNSGPVRWEMHRLGVGKGQGTPGYRCPQISMWSLTQKLSEPCPFGLNWLNRGPLVIESLFSSVLLSSLEVRDGTEGPNSNDTVGSPDNQPSSWGSSKSHCINIKSGVVENACCEYQDTFFPLQSLRKFQGFYELCTRNWTKTNCIFLNINHSHMGFKGSPWIVFFTAK